MTAVFCKFQIEGVHFWPEAPDEYGYLRDHHRHVFHIQVAAKVTEHNRQIEFIHLQHVARELFYNFVEGNYCGIPSFGANSCEMLGDRLIRELTLLEIPVTFVEVAEDGENGAIVWPS